MSRQFNVLFFSCVLCLLPATASYAADRYALVIGNSAYQNVPKLANPTRDANDVGAALERLQFEVTRVNDANVVGMKDAVIKFGGAEIRIPIFRTNLVL